MAVLTPGDVARLKARQDRAYVERAIHELVLSTWNGRKSVLDVNHLFKKIADLAGYKILNVFDLVTEVLAEYANTGWVITEDSFFIVLTDASVS